MASRRETASTTASNAGALVELDELEEEGADPQLPEGWFAPVRI